MLEVVHAGLYSSIQDLGRLEYRNVGVPVSGSMDAYHARLANHILGNDEHVAVLEMTLQGGKFEFHNPTQIVVCGADLSPMLNNQSIRLNMPVHVVKGDILSFGKRIYGVRTYIAIKNGFQTKEVLKSRSFYSGITEKAMIEKGDLIPYQTYTSKSKTFANLAVQKELFENTTIEVYEAPEFEILPKKIQAELFEKDFTIGLNNRMAYQLNELITNDFPSIITSPVLPGTIQLTPSGRLLVLMKDCQTTGGYPRILQLTQKSINALAQRHTNDSICFKKLSI